MSLSLVLASSSRYRAEVLRSAGMAAESVAPNVDEAAFRSLFGQLGAENYALDLARRKAHSVLERLGGDFLVIGADQVGVRRCDGIDHEVTKPTTLDEAVAQILAVAGGTYRLVNGIVVLRSVDRVEFTAIDTHLVHTHPVSIDQARNYVERYEPLDCVGGCRIEDPSGLIERVEGSGMDGVKGMPMAVLRRLIEQACPPGGASGARDSTS